MKKIKSKLNELEQLLKDYKASGPEQRAYRLIFSFIKLAQNAASFKSRVKTQPNGQEQAAKLNEAYLNDNPKPKEKEEKRRGRPRKKENVLASTTENKTLTEKLKND